ncbi:MAG: hypothetical protein EA376_04085 [Phycisphaeraceae bacterium]|nr:MAG: hypothetical protein EA376_04085 [Phycisphaeraceae bacterium]
MKWRESIGRGAFLACSWTWCIGMFLPVILIAEFGWPGWLVFAVPNVLGAMAMGLILRRPGAAEGLRQAHPGAMVAFSIVTMAFHAFFAAWLAIEWMAMLPMRDLPGDAPLWLYAITTELSKPWLLALVVWFFAMLMSRTDSNAWKRWAMIFFGISALLITASVMLGVDDRVPLLPAMTGLSDASGLLWLAPVCIFGFALCPWLDLTFLRTRIETPGRTGDLAFLLGFGGFFLAMITGTLLYAGTLVVLWTMGGLVITHIVIQSIFTVGAHMRELIAILAPRSAILTIGALLLPLAAWIVPPLLDQALGNVSAYLVFMAAYGLVFPSYVWIVMIPRRRMLGTLAGRLALPACIGAICLAAPLFWIGFIERHWWALAPGVAIPLLTPAALALFAGRGVAGAPARSSAEKPVERAETVRNA